MKTEKPFVYVALDYDNFKENLALAHDLVEGVKSEGYGFKLNLDGVLNFGPDSPNACKIVSSFIVLNCNIFVDLKMWNGGRTMENLAKGCADLGISIINAYPHAGNKFIERIKQALSGSRTRLFTLTVLTHYTEEDTCGLYNLSLSDAVRMFVEMGLDYGADGIIVPGTQLLAVSDLEISKLVPAIRPSWYEDKKTNDQEQTVTPTEAVGRGANFLVVGSPIRKSKNPVEALEKILQEVNNI
jgi:orotidine-5'-phosphate decarboxylase